MLVKPGQEAEVIASSQAAGDDNDWLNVDDPAIVAHTRLIEGGQSNTITFTAAPGTYTYLCSCPRALRGGREGHARHQVARSRVERRDAGLGPGSA